VRGSGSSTLLGKQLLRVPKATQHFGQTEGETRRKAEEIYFHHATLRPVGRPVLSYLDHGETN